MQIILDHVVKAVGCAVIMCGVPQAAVAEFSLYKNIELGKQWEDTIGLPSYYDCSEQGLAIACLDGHNFLNTTGSLYVVFDGERAVRVIYSSDDISLYQNAFNFFPRRGYNLVGIETTDGMLDYVALVGSSGVEAATSKLTEIESAGLSAGYVKYFLLEDAPETIYRQPNFHSAYMALPRENRLISIAVEETLQWVGVSITFEASFAATQKIKQEVSNELNDDF
ncbi:MAG: hypothetical protein MK042_05815 [Cognatishimia sp.]|nr:hypothetical protein [Cognatishimia sp.]